MAVEQHVLERGEVAAFVECHAIQRVPLQVDPDGWLGRAREDMLHERRLAHLASAFHEEHRLVRYRVRDEPFESALSVAFSVRNTHIC